MEFVIIFHIIVKIELKFLIKKAHVHFKIKQKIWIIRIYLLVKEDVLGLSSVLKSCIYEMWNAFQELEIDQSVQTITNGKESLYL